MDGAVNMNPSNAPRILTSGEAKKVEKSIALEAAAAEKHVAQVSKALKSAIKEEEMAEKVTRKAQQVHDKAVKSEHKMAQALSEARHKHELAVASENKAMNDFSMRQRHLQEAHDIVESRRSELEEAQRSKDAGDVVREERLHHTQHGTASGAAAPTNV